jgi:hypothetical protein
MASGMATSGKHILTLSLAMDITMNGKMVVVFANYPIECKCMLRLHSCLVYYNLLISVVTGISVTLA